MLSLSCTYLAAGEAHILLSSLIQSSSYSVARTHIWCNYCRLSLFVLKDCICVNNASMVCCHNARVRLWCPGMLGQMEGLLAADCVIGQLVAPYFRMENFRLAPGHEIIMDCLKRRRQSLYAADVSRQRLSSRVVSAEVGR